MNYFSQVLGPETTPTFLKARSAEGLKRAMRVNALKQKGFVQYTAIQWVEGERSWYAWFYVSDRSMADELMRSQASE